MLKLNISLLLKKCLELWRNLFKKSSKKEGEAPEKASPSVPEVKEEYCEVEDNRKIDFDESIEDLLRQERVIQDGVPVVFKELVWPDEEESKDDSTFELADLKYFFEEYVGLMIDSVQVIGDNSIYLSQFKGKILSEIKFTNDEIILVCSNFNGTKSIQLSLSVTSEGEFVDSAKGIDPEDNCRYRILFFGGRILEYTDIVNGKFLSVK